jgi:hypothetical protein
VLDPGTAYLTTSLLEGVVDRGTGVGIRALGLTGPIAGKTGTTDEEYDLWFVGFTPEIVAVVWVGYDGPKEIGVPSSRGALPIWADFLAEVTGSRVRGVFARPGAVERIDIEPATGARALAGCPESRPEYFLIGTGPTQTCPVRAPGQRGFFNRLFGSWGAVGREDLGHPGVPGWSLGKSAGLRGLCAIDVRGSEVVIQIRRSLSVLLILNVLALAGCVAGERFVPQLRSVAPPLTASGAIGLYDSARDASLQLVLSGLGEDQAGRPSRALASYQRAVRVDPTNPHAFLALSRHHLEGGSLDEASAFLDQARSLFEAEGRLGPSVDVWGLGLRAGIDRAQGRADRADRLFERARSLSPEIWGDGRLSAAELR